jgi:hypothetical protein
VKYRKEIRKIVDIIHPSFPLSSNETIISTSPTSSLITSSTLRTHTDFSDLWERSGSDLNHHGDSSFSSSAPISSYQLQYQQQQHHPQRVNSPPQMISSPTASSSKALKSAAATAKLMMITSSTSTDNSYQQQHVRRLHQQQQEQEQGRYHHHQDYEEEENHDDTHDRLSSIPHQEEEQSFQVEDEDEEEERKLLEELNQLNQSIHSIYSTTQYQQQQEEELQHQQQDRNVPEDDNDDDETGIYPSSNGVVIDDNFLENISSLVKSNDPSAPPSTYQPLTSMEFIRNEFYSLSLFPFHPIVNKKDLTSSLLVINESFLRQILEMHIIRAISCHYFINSISLSSFPLLLSLKNTLGVLFQHPSSGRKGREQERAKSGRNIGNDRLSPVEEELLHLRNAYLEDHLLSISIHSTSLTLLDSSINRFCMLTFLDLSNNQIKEISSLILLPKLLYLNLSYNCIKSLDYLQHLTSLKTLILSYNKIKSFKSCINHIISLSTTLLNLDLSNNPVS